MSDLGLDLGHEKRHKPRRAFGCLAVVLALAILGAGGFYVFSTVSSALDRRLHPPADYAGAGSGRVLVQVKDGQAATDIAVTLAQKDVVASSAAFIDAARTDAKSVGIQVGYYQMRRKMSAASALQLLVDPANLIREAVTVPEGLTVEEIVAKLAKDTKFSARQFRRALRGDIGLPSYAKGNPEGYLFPATYELSPNATARSVLKQMVARYDQEATSLDLVKKAQRLGFSAHDLVTIASLIQGEARFAKDFPKVSRVIYNRLKQKMPLQFDSTVKYAVGKNGRVGTSNADRNSNSPYNTYKVPGLPPTPISAPGQQALDAALNPAKGTWLYFVTVNPETGVTKFATSYAQHLRNKALFDAYCARTQKC